MHPKCIRNASEMHPKCIRNASEMHSKFRLAIGHFSSESLSIDSTPNWSETPIWNWMSTLHRIATFGFLVSLVSFKLVGDCNFHFQIQSISFAINQNWAFKLDIQIGHFQMVTFGFLVSLVSFKLVGDCNFHLQIQSISFTVYQNWTFSKYNFKIFGFTNFKIQPILFDKYFVWQRSKFDQNWTFLNCRFWVFGPKSSKIWPNWSFKVLYFWFDEFHSKLARNRNSGRVLEPPKLKFGPNLEHQTEAMETTKINCIKIISDHSKSNQKWIE